MKLNIAAALLLFFGVFACTSTTPSTTKTPKPEAPPMVGGDADEHGCKASAGYQWSAIKQNCIRIFEDGIRLDPQDKSLNETLSAYAVFKSATEDAQVELFMPNQRATLLLDKTTGQGDGTAWKRGDLTLTESKGMFTLIGANKQVLYQGHRK